MKSNVCYQSNPCSQPPSVVTVQTVDGIKRLSNCYVYVISNNTTYYVSSCKEITVISSGPVFVSGYNPAENPLNLRAQACYDFTNNKAYVFSEAGEYRVFNLTEVNA